MTRWEKAIVDAFIESYFTSAGETLRLRSVSIFPDFETAVPDEKESYLEAAEALERKGLLTLKWEKRDKGERLKTLYCAGMSRLFEAAQRPDPKAEAEAVRSMIKSKIPVLEKCFPVLYREASGWAEASLAFLHFLADSFGPSGFRRGVDRRAAEDFIRLLEFFFNPAERTNVSIRSLSVLLFGNSKRAEELEELFAPLFQKARRQDVPVPDLSFLERSFPETMISGKVIVEYGGRQNALVNSAGLMLSFPLASVREVSRILSIRETNHPAVLTIENKETFYALGDPGNYRRAVEKRAGGSEAGDSEAGGNGAAVMDGGCFYDCYLYTGGYPNQAAAGLIKILAASGFSFYHAGDLDPGGILILQNVMDIAGRPVTPVKMDAAVFDKYLPWARPLHGGILRQAEHIRPETLALPGMAELLARITKTRRGVEQEIIDYRD